ncbi:hypothetical protein ACPUVO_08680 [Pseudocolwellia sp. HL-MZ19]|uniref:hypothetical protein n=1 Tax=Pseudocolwellia sp. HL-MZ19 TaxID=3400846 RepID=UPI003CF535FC
MDENPKYISLTNEKSSIDVYKLTRNIPFTRENKVIYGLSLIFLFIVNFLGKSSLEIELKELVTYTDSFISWALSLLGFVLAGYSIFASLMDKDLQLELASRIEERSKLNFLKYSHCLFIKILFDLIILIFCAFFIKVSIDKEIFDILIKKVGIDINLLIYLIILIKSVLYSTFVLLLLLSKSFIFNIYHTIMISVRWHGKNKKK